MFGMEDALFFPSGTMANQTAIKILTQPGDRMFCDKWAHVYNFEGGGAAFNSGVTSHLIDGNRGMFTAKQLFDAVSGRTDIHVPWASLVVVENTTNKGGGACWEYEELLKIRKFVRIIICPCIWMAHVFLMLWSLKKKRLNNMAKYSIPYQFACQKVWSTGRICVIGIKLHIEKALRVVNYLRCHASGRIFGCAGFMH